MNAALRSISAAGFLLFLAVAIASFAGPRFFERQAKHYLVQRLKAEIAEQYPALAPSGVIERLGIRLQAQAVANRRLLESRYPEAVGVLLSSLCKHDCAGESAWTAFVRSLLSDHLERLQAALERVREWTQGRFDQLIDRLMRDVRVFAMTNAFMFLLAFVMASAEPASRAVKVVAGALIGGAIAGTALYLFAQNWLQTVMFSDYAGGAYLVWVALIVAAELDLLLNRGRVLGGLLGGVA